MVSRLEKALLGQRGQPVVSSLSHQRRKPEPTIYELGLLWRESLLYFPKENRLVKWTDKSEQRVVPTICHTAI